MNLNRLKMIVGLWIAAQGFAAKSDVTLAWSPVQGATITNYTLSWGTNSGVYTLEWYAGAQTNLTVTGLASNTVYYFTVTATAQNGAQSTNSNEVMFTNAPAAIAGRSFSSEKSSEVIIRVANSVSRIFPVFSVFPASIHAPKEHH